MTLSKLIYGPLTPLYDVVCGGLLQPDPIAVGGELHRVCTPLAALKLHVKTVESVNMPRPSSVVLYGKTA